MDSESMQLLNEISNRFYMISKVDSIMEMLSKILQRLDHMSR